MTDFAYWASKCAPGTFMCSHCYEVFPVADAFEDVDGQKWDICKPCQAHETA